MTKNELIKQCRYYKGEERCPFLQAVPSYIWKTECDWVERQLGDDKDKIVSDKSANIIALYNSDGLLDFEKKDGVPKSLKASLYLLFQHWNEGFASFDEWRTFYKNWKCACF